MKEQIFRDLMVDKITEANVILTGLPYDKGCSCGGGARFAPQTIRELSGFLPPLSMDGDSLRHIKIYDNGDVSETEDFYRQAEITAAQVYEQNKFSLFLGGDHSVSIATEKAFAEYYLKHKITPVIIHIDAHPDICDYYNGSNYSHACPNARALDHGYRDENIVMVGIRGYEEQEVAFFEKHPQIRVFNASYLNQFGFQELNQYLYNKYQGNFAIYLSYDIDANDPAFAPGTGTPEAFGLNNVQLMQFIRNIVKELPIKAMDIVEVSPPLDSNNITSWLALKTIYEVFRSLK